MYPNCAHRGALSPQCREDTRMFAHRLPDAVTKAGRVGAARPYAQGTQRKNTCAVSASIISPPHAPVIVPVNDYKRGCKSPLSRVVGGRYPRKAGIWGHQEKRSSGMRAGSIPAAPKNPFVRARSCPKIKHSQTRVLLFWRNHEEQNLRRICRKIQAEKNDR